MTLSFFCSASLSTQTPSLVKVHNLINKNGIPSVITSPQESLRKGNWVKLICGASFEDVIDVRNLSLVYALAGVDCIDCAADESVVNAVNEGIKAAMDIIPKALEFDPNDCPLDCSRPCENVCPADAISFSGIVGVSKNKGGVLPERCYGCGRCLPVCPYDKIKAISYVRDVAATGELLNRDDIDAIEIHTSLRAPMSVNVVKIHRKAESFQELWHGLGDSLHKLRLVAVSLPDIGELTVPAMSSMYETMKGNLHCLNLWQIVGRVLRSLQSEHGYGCLEDYPDHLLEALEL
ncbi:electron transport complex protein RnfB [Striga asiatica]|uniref:Electron transport complex protein RnfB n=1 Tax=Striga asiatica TaxID=4170 RepID=A0A5A7NYN0_STRAF|nr:electron transport complex protein RnfB [Striga asiatica]